MKSFFVRREDVCRFRHGHEGSAKADSGSMTSSPVMDGS